MFKSRFQLQKGRHLLKADVFLFGFRRPQGGSTLRRSECSGQVNCPCAKVFAAGENACTAQKRRHALAPLLPGSFSSTHDTSPRTAYRSRRLFLQKSPLAHFVAAPFQTGPADAGLRFGRPPCGRPFSHFGGSELTAHTCQPPEGQFFLQRRRIFLINT